MQLFRRELVYVEGVILVMHWWVAWIAGASDTEHAALSQNSDMHTSRAGQPAQQVSPAVRT